MLSLLFALNEAHNVDRAAHFIHCVAAEYPSGLSVGIPLDPLEFI